MSLLVLELQRKALDSNYPVTDLLRMALAVATKLDMQDFKSWVEKELNGYDDADEKPAYRTLSGQPVAYDPARGWERLITSNLDPAVVEKMSQFNFHYPVGQFESDLKDKSPSQFAVSYSKSVETKMMKQMNKLAFPAVLMTSAQFQGILDAVRTRVLEWSLKLEQEGIKGEDMIFRDEEKEAAKRLVK
jgi:hypothetical protein